ncbi:histone methylation protein DOT1-domain-containing protein [Mycena filopes]|nr:histone methylation protein DOT1-domain-containing protein [Mycena filopes]
MPKSDIKQREGGRNMTVEELEEWGDKNIGGKVTEVYDVRLLRGIVIPKKLQTPRLAHRLGASSDFQDLPSTDDHAQVRVRLHYPAANKKESYLLYAPKNTNHYNPIWDLEETVYTIVREYLTPEQQAGFGPIPQNRPMMPVYGQHPRTLLGEDDEGILLRLRAASESGDGKHFLGAMSIINGSLRAIKCRSPSSCLNPSWAGTHIPKSVVLRILEENYQRCTGPFIEKLKQHKLSSAVYGEMRPSLVFKIIERTGLTADGVLLDFGSGVGNVVCQTSLATGCFSFGIELQEDTATIAKCMKVGLRSRAKMWGVEMGTVELVQGNLLNNSRVNELVSRADVVLVNNKKFEPRLNLEIAKKFQDLREGTYIVSLEPFARLDVRLTERDPDDLGRILDVSEDVYESGDVSWTCSGGLYYVHRVNRAGYAQRRREYEQKRQKLRT